MQQLSLSFTNAWLVAAILLAVALIAFTIFYYRRTNPPISGRLRVTLAIMRSLVVILLLFSLAEPVFSYLLIRNIPPHIAVLFDNSESIRTVEDFDTKNGVLSDLIDGRFPGQTADGFIRDDYIFADSIAEVAGSLEFEGKQTSLGNCIASLQDVYSDQNLQGVVVISDGLVNSGRDPMSAASELGVPIHTIDLGPQRSSRDIRIVRMTHDDVGYEGKPSEIEIEIESRGFDEMNLPVRVRHRGTTLGSSEVRLAGGDARQTVTMEFVPASEGTRTYSVSVPGQPDEELTDNNSRSFSMKILKSKLRILLASGYPSWELTFLKRAIEASEDFDLDVSVFDRDSRLKTDFFPRSAEDLEKYDLVILLDYSPSILASRVDALSSYLSDHGKAAMFVIGTEFARSMPSGALSTLLPFDTRRMPTVKSTSSFHLQLTEQGKYHPVTQIADAGPQLQKIWSGLPPFEAYIDLGQEKSKATVLAVHPERDSRDNLIPLITVSRVGQGKVLATNFVPLWKTDFLSRGRGGSGDEYRNFVNNCVRWLVATEDVDRIRIQPAKPVFKSGERVTFTASLLDESYQAMENASVILTVLPDSGTSADTLIASMVRSAPGRLRADFHLLNHGQYSYSADVMRDDMNVTTVKGKFVVEAFSLEEETLYEREDLLKELAATSGGGYYPISMLDSLIPKMNLMSGEHSTRREFSLSNNWIILLAVLVLLSLEWWIRKRVQLL